MTSRLGDICTAQVLPALLEQHGQSVTYTAAGGTADAVTLTAAVSAIQTAIDVEDGGRQEAERRREVIIPTATTAAGGYVANPAEGATVTIDTVDYVVEEVDADADQQAAVLRVVRKDPTQWAAPGYRD